MSVIMIKQFYRHRTYIRLEEMHDITWMAKVFSWKVWCIILVMHVMLSICSFWSQKVLVRIENKYKNTNFGEHFFYNFGMLCNQSMNEQFKCFIFALAFQQLIYIYIYHLYQNDMIFNSYIIMKNN